VLRQEIHHGFVLGPDRRKQRCGTLGVPFLAQRFEFLEQRSQALRPDIARGRLEAVRRGANLLTVARLYYGFDGLPDRRGLAQLDRERGIDHFFDSDLTHHRPKPLYVDRGRCVRAFHVMILW